MIALFADTVTLVLAVSISALSICPKHYSYKDNAMPVHIALSPRLEKEFVNTKLACFGRYALTIPSKAELIWGGASFPSRIEIITGGEPAAEQRISSDIAKLKLADSDVDIFYDGAGPTPGSREIRYYENKFAKAEDFFIASTYINMNGLIFMMRDAPYTGESHAGVSTRVLARAMSLRLRTPDEVPREQGYCIEGGFLAGALYDDQEMVNAGLYLPGFPDVTFSISSNKDAYGDYSSEEFERRVRGELSLLARIKGAQDLQGIRYPKRTVLREGKRTVQHWHGEESLIKRADGTHDFEWAFVGTPRDVANPSEYSVHMFTKVAHNTVGAADKASLSDDEAIALWDKLLSGLKFRVKVPGAPEGSYYLTPGATTGSAPL